MTITKYFSLLAFVLVFSSCGQTSKNKSLADVDQFQTVMIDVELKDSSSLMILLAKDGTINRKGDLKTRDNNFFMGMSNENLFDKLKKTITNDLLSYCDKVQVLADTTKRVNKIQISFSSPGVNTGFEYYTDEPVDKLPKPILTFINNAIQITDSWYKSQQEMIKPR